MEKLLKILKDIVKIPSYFDDNHNEKELINYILEFFKKRTKYNCVVQNVEGERKNILVYKKSNPKIALFGHLDTVLPKVGTLNPLKPRIEGDKIYGLGSVDMKSGLAIMLDLATEIENDELSFVFSVDEEYEFKGALKLREYKNFNPKFIINIEPTDNKILNGCRGITEFSFTAHGKSVHAGRKSFGINAIEKSVELIKLFQEELTKLDLLGSGQTSVNLAYLYGGTLKSVKNGNPEISGLGMVVPNYAEVNCEIRVANPKITKKFIQEKIKQIAKKIKLKTDNFKFKFYLGSMITPKSELKQFEKAIVESGEKADYADISLSGYYEVQLLQEKWKSKSVIFGPGPINLSHSVDEYAQISSINKTKYILEKYITNNIGNKHRR